jgi:hypothetical protein
MHETIPPLVNLIFLALSFRIPKATVKRLKINANIFSLHSTCVQAVVSSLAFSKLEGIRSCHKKFLSNSVRSLKNLRM